MIKFIFILLFILNLFSINTLGQKDNRLALVIGNSKYDNTSSLKNPSNDAELISKSLKYVGFRVLLVQDADQRTMEESIRRFGEAMTHPDSSYDVGFFYFAGHGIQHNSHNYLVPTNANVKNEFDIEDYCVNVNKLTRYFDIDNSNLLITVLDACRNNPFSNGRSLGGKGLAKMQVASGSIVAYSTQPGNIALDGEESENSVYSKALSKQIKIPNQTIEEVFKNVRTEVEEKTDYTQSPREESALKGGVFYFSRTAESKSLELSSIIDEMNDLKVKNEFVRLNELARVALSFFRDIEDIDRKSAEKLIEISRILNRNEEFFMIDNQSRVAQDLFKTRVDVYYILINLQDSGQFETPLMSDQIYCSVYYKFLISNFLLSSTNKKYSDSTIASFAKDALAYSKLKFKKESVEVASLEFINALLLRSLGEYGASLKIIENSVKTFSGKDFKDHEIKKFTEYDELKYTALTEYFNSVSTLVQSISRYQLFDYESIKKYKEDKIKDAGFKTFNHLLVDVVEKVNGISNESIEIENVENRFVLIESSLAAIYNIIAGVNEDIDFRTYKQLKISLDKFDKAVVDITKNRIERLSIHRRIVGCKKKIIENNLGADLKVEEAELILSELRSADQLIKRYKREAINSGMDGYIHLLDISILRSELYMLYRHGPLPNWLNQYDMFDDQILRADPVFNDYKRSLPLIPLFKDSLNQNGTNYSYRLDNYFIIAKQLTKIYKKEVGDFRIRLLEKYLAYEIDKSGYGSFEAVKALNELAIGYSDKGLVNRSFEMRLLALRYIYDFSENWKKSGHEIRKNYKIEDLDKFLLEYKSFSLKSICVFVSENDLLEDLDDQIIFIQSYAQKLSKEYSKVGIESFYHVESLAYFHDLMSSYIEESELSKFHSNKVISYALSLLNDGTKITRNQRYFLEELYASANFNLLLIALETNEVSPKYFEELIEKSKVFEEYTPGYEMNYFFQSFHEYQNERSEKEGMKVASRALEYWLGQMKSSVFRTWYLYDSALDWYEVITNYKWIESDKRYDHIELAHKYVAYLQAKLNIKPEELKSKIGINKSGIVEKFKSVYYTLGDQHYWLGNKDSTIYYYKASLRFLKEHADEEYYRFYYESYLQNIVFILDELGESDQAINEYKNIEESMFGSDYDRFINFSIIKKRIGEYEIPFFHLEMILPKYFYPVLEFDVNQNAEYDSIIDKRYFYNYKSRDLSAEFVDTVSSEIGPFKYYHLNREGDKYQDTTNSIYFDNCSQPYSASQVKISEFENHGKLDGSVFENRQCYKYTILIPLDEIKNEDSKNLRFLISTYYPNNESYIHSRRFKKHMFPAASRVRGFNETYSISLD